MTSYKSNQEFYDDIDSVILMLRNYGLINEAENINFLLHKVAWTSNSELFGELKNSFSSILTQNPTLSQPAKAKLNLFIDTINAR